MGYKINPFIWDDSASFVTSPVIKLSIKNQDDADLDIVTSGSEPMINAELPAEFQTSKAEWTEPGDNDTMTFHTMNLTQDGSSVILQINAENKSITYNIFVKYGGRPSLEEFDMLGTVGQDTDFTWVMENASFVHGMYTLGITQSE